VALKQRLRFLRTRVCDRPNAEKNAADADGVMQATRLPDGQITSARRFPLSSPLRKNISVFPKCKSGYMIRRPASLEGRFAIVTDARRDAVDAEAPITNGAEAYGKIVWS
jgi:hypothetical protein